MFNFLMTATGTWALWKLLDRWVDAGGTAAAGPATGGRPDSRMVARELVNLGEPGSAVARAVSRIGECTAPEGLCRVIEGAYAPLSREQRAAVSLVLLLRSRTA